MPFKIIVAKDEQGGIGKDNKLPWYIKDDLKRFATLTRGNGKNAVLMGRNTWNSIPTHPLAHRHNLILSRSHTSTNETKISFFKDVEHVIEYIKDAGFEDIWIIGGEQVYTLFLNKPELNALVKEIYVTEVAGNYECDTFFRTIDVDRYEEISSESVGEKVKFKVYRNKFWTG